MSEQSLGKWIKHLRGEAGREAVAKIVSAYGASGLGAAAFSELAGIAAVTLSR